MSPAQNLFLQIHTLDLSHNNLTAFGAEHFTAFHFMGRLDLSSNKINSIHKESFEPLVNLRDLDLSHNRLTKVPWYNDSVSSLNLARNRLRKLDFGRNMTLHRLDVSGNPLDMHSKVTHLGYVEQLVIRDLPGETLPVAILNRFAPWVKSLDLSGNKVMRNAGVNFRHFNELQILSLSNCKIRQWQSDLLPEVNSTLLELDLSWNTIGQITLKNMDSVQRVSK